MYRGIFFAHIPTLFIDFGFVFDFDANRIFCMNHHFLMVVVDGV